MVPQVESKCGKALFDQTLGQNQVVIGVAAPFPAVQQQDKPPPDAWQSAAVVIPQQPYGSLWSGAGQVFASIDQQWLFVVSDVDPAGTNQRQECLYIGRANQRIGAKHFEGF
jgi:hypothetical protein